MQAGGDLVNLVKQYNEFKLKDKGIGLAVGLMFITDIHSLGADALRRHQFTDAWYWNFDQQNRAWADRFQAKTGNRPTFAHAGELLGGDAVPRGGPAGRHRRRRTRSSSTLEGYKFNDFFAAQRHDPRRGPPGASTTSTSPR